MNKEIANILKNKIADLPFIDLLAGLAQVVETRDPTDDGKVNVKRNPASYDTNICNGEQWLIPDGSRKSVIYFEDGGVRFVSASQGFNSYSSSLVLVCWMNRGLLFGDPYIEVAGRMTAQVISRIQTQTQENWPPLFSRVMVKPARVLAQDWQIFNKYTYDQATTQYLRPPFEYFAIEFITTFSVAHECAEGGLQYSSSPCKSY